MRRNYVFILFFLLLLPFTTQALLSMELTQGKAGAIPLAIVPFSMPENAPQDVSTIITHDLQNSGRFKIFGKENLNQFPNTVADVSNTYFKKLGTDHVAIGKVSALGGDQYQVSFQLLDIYKEAGPESIILSKTYTVPGSGLRTVAHRISDVIYEQLTGVRGIFSTKLAYVVVQRNQNHARYILEVADQDGYNPKPLLVSYEPIMSPAWSPDGKQIAYVSFENKRAGIYIENVTNGTRRLLSEFPGINGAPAWSPDGNKLALVLSKSGAPNIYIMDVHSRQLKQVTKDFYINTEPSWSRDGKFIIFTSNRSGGPQIYQANLGSGAISRVSFDGDYNARPSFTYDGKHIAMIHRVAGLYKIALLNLDSGTTKVLTAAHKSDSASPSVAPNGSMILYDTLYQGRNVLAMVSSDGSIHLVLPARNGEAQDPAWSPYLS